jgi:hypothetical protein
LGALLGYQKIPAYWKMGLKEAEDINFKYTDISLNKVYNISFNHALENIKRNGGKIGGDKIIIAVQTPKTVRLEQGFTGLIPIEKKDFENSDLKDTSFDFEGTGFVLRGEAVKKNKVDSEYVFEAVISIDGQRETVKWPTDFTIRRHDLCWKYLLPKGKHTVSIKVLNPNDNYQVQSADYIVYSDKPVH